MFHPLRLQQPMNLAWTNWQRKPFERYEHIFVEVVSVGPCPLALRPWSYGACPSPRTVSIAITLVLVIRAPSPARKLAGTFSREPWSRSGDVIWRP
eukprot:7146152-Pyramimonas_sp.AAC.1